MKPIVIFAGTSEGRILAEALNREKRDCHVCVATEYGERIMTEGEHVQIHAERMDLEQMISFLRACSPEAVVDATHPYAAEVSANIRSACEAVKADHYRLVRRSEHVPDMSLDADGDISSGMIHYVNSVEEAAHYLNGTEGNVLLTTGGKELHKYAQIVQDQERLYARVLSVEDSIRECLRLGFEGKRLICMQGPFSEEMNYALLKQTDAAYMVTKESGAAGGFAEKLRAAKRAGVKCVIVRRPNQETGYSLRELVRKFAPKSVQIQVTLLGIGMGAPENMTLEGERACRQADVFIGAKRMLQTLEHFKKPSVSMYRTEEIVDYIKAHPEYKRVLVALSGDVGFYSGAKKLVTELERDTAYKVEMLCGISSPVYFAAKLHLSWDDMYLMSLHGKEQNLIRAVETHEKVFALVGKANDIRELAQQLCTYGYGQIQMYVGTDLSYPDESILSGTPEEFLSFDRDGVSVVILVNEGASEQICTHGIADGAFSRAEVPMTKEEVRSVSLSKLRLKETSVIYDVGAGTGSVSVECARQAGGGMVYAIEQKDSALGLLQENKIEFRAFNMQIIPGKAPEALKELPKPTHVFIGGSSGQMKEILKTVFEKNPAARVVVNAIALETVAETMNCLRELSVEDVDIVSVSVGKSKTVAQYHMMMGQNPVYIISFQGKGEVK